MLPNYRWCAAFVAIVSIAAHAAIADPIGIGEMRDGGLAAAPPAAGETQTVAFFPAAANPNGWAGFVRVANHSSSDGSVSIRAFDDGGRDFGTLTLSIDAGETVHFNSEDLEDGNPTKGLPGGTGRPARGDWRLELTSDLQIEVMAYVRTSDGLLTAMHDVAPDAGGDTNAYRVVTFNPGSNRNQQSLLRLVNAGASAAAVVIRGVDDRGGSGGPVRVSIPAGAARTLSAADLESRSANGSLGNGAGKWRLDVESDAPILVMSLLNSPTGHVTNLSTVPVGTVGAVPRPAPDDPPPTMDPGPPPPAPEVVIESTTEIRITWTARLEAGSNSFNAQLKFKEDEQWEGGCLEFAPDSGGTYDVWTVVTLREGTTLPAGQIVQARYRNRNEPLCEDSASAPGSWSEVGETTVADAPSVTYGAISVDFYVSPVCPGLAAGIALNHTTQAAAANAARRACRADGGSTSECNEETGTFEGCAAMSYGVEGTLCGYYFGVSDNSLAAAEADALRVCRGDNNTGCRIWTNGSGTRISGCNRGGASSHSPMGGIHSMQMQRKSP